MKIVTVRLVLFFLLMMVQIGSIPCYSQSAQETQFVYINRMHGGQSLIFQTQTERVIQLPEGHRALTTPGGQVFVNGISNPVVRPDFSGYVIDTLGQTIGEIEGDLLRGVKRMNGSFFIKGIRDVKARKNTYHLYGANGLPLELTEEYIYLKPGGQDLFIFQTSAGQRGYMNAQGEIKVTLPYDAEKGPITGWQAFSEGLAVVTREGPKNSSGKSTKRYFAIDQSGLEVIDFQRHLPNQPIHKVGTYCGEVFPVFVQSKTPLKKQPIPPPSEDRGFTHQAVESDEKTLDLIFLKLDGTEVDRINRVYDYEQAGEAHWILNCKDVRYNTYQLIYDMRRQKVVVPEEGNRVFQINDVSNDYYAYRAKLPVDSGVNFSILREQASGKEIFRVKEGERGLISLAGNDHYVVMKGFGKGKVSIYRILDGELVGAY